MTEMLIGYGGGKGGGGGHTPVEERDSLRSVQYAEILDLVGEGEMQGLVNGLRSVYFDRVPLQNADGTMNFEGVYFAATPGTQGQAALSGFDNLQNEVAVSVQVLYATPIVRSISAPGVNRVRVTLSVPSLGKTNTSNGDITGTQVDCGIYIQNNGGGFNLAKLVNFVGKTNSKYQRATVLDLPGSGPWDIKVQRLTQDAATVTTEDKVFWDSYTEIQSVKLRYPNSVVHGLRVSAQQFARIPDRAYDMMGLRMQIPSNYNPITRVYTGNWNGTFTIGWTNNPAWVYYAMCTNPRFGLGDFVDAALIDKWELYRIAQYSDALVPDGRGGQEPRFTCNLVLQTRQEAYRVLQDIAGLFRGLSYWNAGAVQFSQDAPSSPEVLFSPANVLDGDFTYASTSANVRNSMAIVYWNNPADFFKRVPEVVVDDALVAKYGIRQIELSPVGITSRGQAARIGKWALLSEDLDAVTISFATGMEGGGVRMGRIFKVADPNEAGERLGGRIRVATTTAVTLDSPVTIAAGETYTLTVMYPDALLPLGYKTEERAVTNGAGVHSTINVTPALSQVPEAQTMWMLASNAVNPTLWRCIGVKEICSEKYEISGVAHNPSKYGAIEMGLKLENKPISRLTSVAITPTSLKFTEVLYVDRSTYKSRLTVGWVPAAAAGAAAQRYRVSWRFNTGVWTQLPEMSDASIDVNGLDPGLVEVSIRSVNSLGNQSLPLAGSTTLVGKLAPPGPMSNFIVGMSVNGVLATWDDPSDIDPDWQAAELATNISFSQRVTFKRSTTHLLGWLLAGVRTFYGRHWDEERSSLVPASASITILPPGAPTFTKSATEFNRLNIQFLDAKTSQPIAGYFYQAARIVGGIEQSKVPWGGAGADSRSDTLPFTEAGDYNFYMYAVDVAGNIGVSSSFPFSIKLPNDFKNLLSSNSAFTGTMVNAAKSGPDQRVRMLVNTTETWGQHFASRGWANIAAQVAAGYSLYFQPGVSTASYTEDSDIGKLFTVATVNVTLVSQVLAGSPTVTVTIGWSANGTSWTYASPGVTSVAVTNVRYVRRIINAIASGGLSLVELISLQTNVNVQRVTENTGVLAILASDTNGTLYTTTSGFSDVTDCQMTEANTGTPVMAYMSWITDDAAAPTVPAKMYFFARDVAGNRISGNLSANIIGV
jgi:predicted phage tail protein